MMFVATISFALLGLLSLPSVYAHGSLASVAIDGKVYDGNLPGSSGKPSAIRTITDVSPVKGVENANLACGQGARPAQLVADASPGSTLAFSWQSGNVGTPWPHDTGPIMTYMAECTGTTCDKFDANQAKWFKIDEAGQVPGGGGWVQGVTFHQGKPYSVKLPSNIAPGEYLVRNEIIALHVALTAGAEFYPACVQVRVGGSGTGVPSPSQEVSFPGGYSSTEPGILFDAYAPGAKYSFPGPPLSNLVAGGAPASSPNATAPVNAGPSPPSAPDGSAASTSSPSVQVPSATAIPVRGATGACKKRTVKKRHFRFARQFYSH